MKTGIFITTLVVGFILLFVGAAIYGLVLAFKASIILGIAALIIEPSPTIIGFIGMFGHPEVCEKLAAWLHLPF